jgi:hypothetical protein
MNDISQISLNEEYMDIDALPLTQTEIERGTLSNENIQLGALLLACRGYVILRKILTPSLSSDLQDSMTELIEDCLETQRDQTFQDLNKNSKMYKSHKLGVQFWERSSRLRIFPKLVGPFADISITANSLILPILQAALDSSFYCKSVKLPPAKPEAYWVNASKAP